MYTSFRPRAMTDVVADGLLCVLELAVLGLLFGIDATTIGSFAFFFLAHFFLTGVVICLIAVRLKIDETLLPDIVTIGVIADCALLAIAWRLDITSFYIFYPIAFLIFALGLHHVGANFVRRQFRATCLALHSHVALTANHSPITVVICDRIRRIVTSLIKSWGFKRYRIGRRKIFSLPTFHIPITTCSIYC